MLKESLALLSCSITALHNTAEKHPNKKCKSNKENGVSFVLFDNINLLLWIDVETQAATIPLGISSRIKWVVEITARNWSVNRLQQIVVDHSQWEPEG